MLGTRRLYRRLFAALDGHSLLVAGERWRVTVFSVSKQRGAIWLQALAAGRHHGRRMLLINLGPQAGVRAAFEQLTARLQHFEDVPALIEGLRPLSASRR